MTFPSSYFLSATGLQASLPADEDYSFGVLETMRAQDGGIPLFSGHMARLTRSSHLDSATLKRIAEAASDIALHTATWPLGARVRLRYGALNGELVWDFAVVPLEAGTSWEQGVALLRCRTPVTPAASSSPFSPGMPGQSSESRHGLAQPSASGCKLLHRGVYGRAEGELERLSKLLRPELLRPELFHEGLLLDEKGLVVEGLRSNLLVWSRGQWRTPNLRECGVRGVMLNWLASQVEISEDALSIRDIEQAEEVVVCNAVRGVVPVVQLALSDSQAESGAASAGVLSCGAATSHIRGLVAEVLW